VASTPRERGDSEIVMTMEQGYLFLRRRQMLWYLRPAPSYTTRLNWERLHDGMDSSRRSGDTER
jgi:hypothetical protein